MKRTALATVLCLAASAAAGAPVTLSHPPRLAKDNAALPRIASPTTPATARINAALARLDARWKGFIRQCRGDGGPQAYLTRSVAVTMAGPKVLSLLVSDEVDCGGAHPDGDSIALAYDIGTGRLLDWTKLLPRRLVSQVKGDNVSDGSIISAVVSPPLHEIYLRKANADHGADASWKSNCADLLADDELAFQIWPDAKAGGLMIQPFDLPHVVAACADTVAIPAAELRPLGVDMALLDAVEAAHAGR